ncbi:MAG TPA: patatin-like phospholipase family protein [Chitinophagales bacterium]|nr:patatin-like phospholipase family protein [Chitinophagales bacterium]
MPIKLTRKPRKHDPEADTIYPFTDIAVSLSGGGFRASAYSLGCLSYLQRRSYNGLPLLERVKFITSASGGTLTSLLFSAYNHLGIPFTEVYNRLRKEILIEDKLLKDAAEIIADDAQWSENSGKSRNTINAFAKAFQHKVFDNLEFGVFWAGKGTLEEVCFNTSELENGRTFRFQTDGDNATEEIIGNPYLCIRSKNIRGIKKIALGDIMAASACYPAGFEPMVFPDDFVRYPMHQQDLKDALVKAVNHNWSDYEPYTKSFVIMDGGITDNQGIESLRLANKRRMKKNKRGFDTVLICDVANYFLEPFEPLHEETTWWSRISMYNIISIHKYAPFIFAAAVAMIFTTRFSGLGWVLATVSSLMFATFMLGTYLMSRTPDPVGSMNMFNVPLGVFMNYFLKSPISRTGLMIKARWRSTMRVGMEIYDIHLRRVNYEAFYMDPDWVGKAKSVSIYELSKGNEHVFQRLMTAKDFDAETKELLTPSEAIKSVAEYARRMGTTLWFSKDDMTNEKNILDALIACGQFTMCYNLLEYIIELEADYPAVKEDSVIQCLKTELLHDWKLFQVNPKFMVIDFMAATGG